MVYFSGKNRAAQYPAIAEALTKGKIFADYKVILVNGPVIVKNESTLEYLANFLANPHKQVPWEKIGPEQDYRFFFVVSDTHPSLVNSQVYADVDIRRKVILVRTPGLLKKGEKTNNYFIEPKKK